MTVEEYLAQGGTITRLPPGVAMHGHSEHQQAPALAPAQLGGKTWAEGVAECFSGAKAGRDAINAKRSADALKRGRKLLAAFRDGMTWDQLAEQEGCTRETIRKRLGEARKRERGA